MVQIYSAIEERESFTPVEIRFTREQVRRLLKSWDLLKAGEWPENLRDDTVFSKVKGFGHAYFESIALIVAELEVRLAMAKQDGLMCQMYYTGQMDEDKIAQRFNKDIRDTGRRIKRALAYVSGWKRKRLSYAQWKSFNWSKRRISNSRLVNPS